MPAEDAKWQCDVCRGCDASSEDQLILCDGCDVGVHQFCYMVDQIPTGNWYCDHCVSNKRRKTITKTKKPKYTKEKKNKILKNQNEKNFFFEFFKNS